MCFNTQNPTQSNLVDIIFSKIHIFQAETLTLISRIPNYDGSEILKQTEKIEFWHI